MRGEDEREASFSDSSAVRLFLFLFLGAIACPSACDGRLCGAMPTGSVVFLFFLDLFFRCAVLLAHALHSLRSPAVSVILSKVFTLVCVALFSSLREQVCCAGVSSVEVRAQSVSISAIVATFLVPVFANTPVLTVSTSAKVATFLLLLFADTPIHAVSTSTKVATFLVLRCFVCVDLC